MRAALGVVAVALWLLLGHVGTAAAAEGLPPADVTFTELGQPDATLRGRVATLTVYVPGGGDVALGDGSELRVRFSHSELLLGKSSALTAFWNGVALRSVALDKTNAAGGTLVVPLAARAVKPDVNELRLTFAMQLSDDDCGDVDNPARSSVVSGDSVVHYDYRPGVSPSAAVAPGLAAFPAPFVRPNRPRPGAVRIVLPDAPTRGELTAAATLALRFGRAAGVKPLDLAASSASALDPAAAADDHLVFVGTAGDLKLPADVADALPVKLANGALAGPDGQPAPAGSGVVAVAASPRSAARSVLLVAGSDDAALVDAALALGSADYARLLKGAYGFVDRVDRPAPTPAAAGPRAVTFADLGLADTTLRGAGDHTISLTFESPPPVDRATYTLDVDLSASPLLDPSTSSVQIVLNAVPLTGVKLEGGERTTRIGLPTADLRAGLNTLQLQFSQRLPAATGCTMPDDQGAWTVVRGASRLTFPAVAAPDVVSLAAFPYPFVRNGSLDGALLVLPDDPTQWAAGLTLAVNLGRRLPPDGGIRLDAALAGQVTDADRQGRDLLVVGTAPANPMVRALAPTLPLAFDAAGRLALQRGSQVLIAVLDPTRVGVVEEVPSSGTTGRVTMLISGTTPEALGWVNAALQLQGLGGNLAVVTPGDTPDRPQVAAYSVLPPGAAAASTSRLPSPQLMAGGLVALATAGLLGWLGLGTWRVP